MLNIGGAYLAAQAIVANNGAHDGIVFHVFVVSAFAAEGHFDTFITALDEKKIRIVTKVFDALFDNNPFEHQVLFAY